MFTLNDNYEQLVLFYYGEVCIDLKSLYS